ncbi:MAG: 7-carboxy-7-deazaguanine synthase QueE [Gammaproteobacteria bacterium]|nr:7-carboxy-7-deazaguanine synthase QueE [Gammaproteobacteria bacterium]MBU1645086.1 7-carboxy-7-deazaguanine synthase QueE [Gammaproteobacteria bacterium]MBU1973323.1 7-carboxy-7-deazaguanine synthase QueE [Gammaproteobacteria bacterium]
MTAEAGAKLRISEIFHSIQGESSRAGLPTVFVRLTGCPLRCTWCDTEYAFAGGEAMSTAQVLDRVAAFGCPVVCVTGGEPLAQKSCHELLVALCDGGYSVSLETSGALDVCGVDARVSRIVDLKAPDSGECDKNRWENLACLNPRDELKIVLASEADYLWAKKSALAARRLDEICPVLFSPVAGKLDPAQLAEWILRDRLPVRFQLQMHKLLWSEPRGR